MKVSVQRTWKNVFKAKAVGDTIYVLANLWLSDNEIKDILSQNMQWFDKHRCEKPSKNQSFVSYNRRGHTQNQQTNRPQNGFGCGCEHGIAYNNLCVNNQNLYKTDGTQENAQTRQNRQSASDSHDANVAMHVDNNKERYNFCNMFCGKELLYFGKIVAVNPSATARTRLDKDVLFIFDDAFAQKDTRIKAIKTFLKRSAKDLLTKQIATFGSCVSLCAERIEFKELGSAWIDCKAAAERMICVDFRVVQLPENLQRYLIAHCFAHFGSADHDENFCRKLRYYVPYFTQCEEELSRYDFLLEI